MSGLPLKADIDRRHGEVRFVPEADIGRLIGSPRRPGASTQPRDNVGPVAQFRRARSPYFPIRVDTTQVPIRVDTTQVARVKSFADHF
jgi:hypothetical protein